MGLQRYRADRAEPQPDGTTLWWTDWIGGPTLAKISNCHINGTTDRRTVYITGSPDTYFSQPATCQIRNKTIKGWVTRVDNKIDDKIVSKIVFHPLAMYERLWSDAYGK